MGLARSRSCSTTSATTGCTAPATRCALLLGGARGAPPEPGLQPLHRAAPDQLGRLGWIFYLPMAVLGVPPLVFGVVALIDLLYQYWVHTEQVGKLGWFDRWFCSPSNHRVHHAVNDGYLDRNYGGILIVWDRLFGSFQEEGEPCVYGTRSRCTAGTRCGPTSRSTGRCSRTAGMRALGRQAARVVQAAGMAARRRGRALPQPAFDSLERVTRYHPPMTNAVAWFAGLQFAPAAGRRGPVPVARRPAAAGAVGGVAGGADRGAVGRGRGDAGPHRLHRGAADRGGGAGHRRGRRLDRPAPRLQAAGDAAGDRRRRSRPGWRRSAVRRASCSPRCAVPGGRRVPDVPRLLHPGAGELPGGPPLLPRAVPPGRALVPSGAPAATLAAAG